MILSILAGMFSTTDVLYSGGRNENFDGLVVQG